MKSIFQKITVQKVVKGFRYLKHYGWYEKHKATAEQIEKQKKQAEKWNDAPKISIVVPLFKTPETFLRAMISPYRHRPMATGSYALRMEAEPGMKMRILKRLWCRVLQMNMHLQMRGSSMNV